MPRGKKAKPASVETNTIEKTKEEETKAVEPKEDAAVEPEKPAKQTGKKKADMSAEDGKSNKEVETKAAESVVEAKEEADKPLEKPGKQRGKKKADKATDDGEPTEKKAKPAPEETVTVEKTKEEDTKAVEPSVEAEEETEKPAKGRGMKKADKATENGEPAAKKSKDSKAEEKSKLRKESSLTAGMDFTHDCQTKDGRKPNWKIASWNVNGIRAWMDKGGLSYLNDESPDVLCIQETKCATEDIPSDVKVDGYHDYWSSAEKAGYAGTAIYSKTKPLNVTYGLGIDKHDDEGRVITAEFDKFYLVTAYVPNAGRGLPRLPYRAKEWDVDFRAYLNELNKKKPVIMCGDLNVAHEEIDLANPKTNKKTAGFTVEERKGFTDLLGEGYIDSFRVLYPEKEGAYTFWTYMGNARGKNVGWRLDYFVLSERLRGDLCDHVIRKDVMGSDHCPVVLYMAIK